MPESDAVGLIEACLVCEMRGFILPRLEPLAIFDSVESAETFIHAQPPDGTHYWYIAQRPDGLMHRATSVKKWGRAAAKHVTPRKRRQSPD